MKGTNVIIVCFYLIFCALPSVYDASNASRVKRSQNSDICGSKIRIVNGPGELSSPLYPSNYPSNVKCRWILKSLTGSQIKLVVTNMQIEYGDDCDYDRLEISNVIRGSSENGDVVLCGSKEDQSFVTNSSETVVKFISDLNYEEKGFSMKYSNFDEAATPVCNITLKGSSGSVTSPGYPDNYPDNMDCWMKIQVDEGMRINLMFDSLLLEYSGGKGCKYDYLRVYDGDVQNNMIGEYCQDRPVNSLDSIGNTMTLHFRSDEFLNNRGFKAVYHAMKGQAQVRTVEAGKCIWDIEPENGTIATPNYPKKYPSNTTCVIKILAPSGYLVRLKFVDMEMEQMADQNTLFDYVRLYDGPSTNDTILGTFAGNTVPEDLITSSDSSLTVEFVSDNFVSYSGFKATYRFVNPSAAKVTNVTDVTNVEPPGDKSSVNRQLLEVIPQDAAVTLGNSHVMNCKPRHKSTTITWMKGQHIIKPNTIHGVEVLGDGSLSINIMTRELEGSYTCVALASDGKTAEVTVILFTRDVVKQIKNCNLDFEKKPSNKTLLIGEFVFLECYVPDAKLLWKHNGVDIRPSHNRFTILHNGFLSINNIQEIDSGVYSCTARHLASGCVRSVSSVINVIKPANVEKVCGKPRIAKPVLEKPRLEHGKIVNGFAAKKGAYPWMAMLYTTSLGAYCGGSVINERWIVSAAHCFTTHKIPFSQIRIKLGKRDKSIDEPSERVVGVEHVVPHPQFDMETYDNDIALVKLKGYVTFTDFILPICLGTKSYQENRFFGRWSQMGTATGWGRKWSKGPKSRMLLEVVLPIVDRSVCKTSTKYTVTDNMFCAGYALAGAGDTCQGDSGGPFSMEQDGTWYLVGVTSWGEKCSASDKYGYYTKVGRYITWIHDMIKL